MIHPAFFYPVSILCVAGALGVVLARHPVYAVLSLGVTLFGLSSLFVALQAYFVAVIQILVYAGAILVLFLFVVMLLDLGPEALVRARTRTLAIGGVLVAFLFLRQFTKVALSPSFAPAAAPVAGTTAAVGQELFTTFALPFEAASLILLAGIVGAIVLAQKKA
jgi:NADH-quinone oxidoreductase subunit J